MPLAILGLGSNLGGREENMAAALDLLEANPSLSIERLSSLYETKPFDVQSKQDNYLNCCVLIQTTLTPEALLDACHEVERSLGRVRLEYHGARTMDVDILLYENAALNTEVLTLPHKGILSRAFVLVPLADLFPAHMALGLDFSHALRTVDTSAVWLYK